LARVTAFQAVGRGFESRLPLQKPQILSHSDISTTAIYTHLLTEDMVKSYDQYSPANSLSL
jgi:site-specific recombinase XerD